MRYVTVGESVHYRVTPYAGDMAWLGDAPGDRESRRYEAARRHRHLSALADERSEIEAQARSLASEFVETTRQKERQVKALNEVAARLAERCLCDICRTVSAEL